MFTHWTQIWVQVALQPLVLWGTSLPKVEKNGKFIEWPQPNPEHFQKHLYTLKTCTRGTHVGVLRSATCRFLDTRLLKIGNATNDLRLPLNTYQSQIPVYTEYLPVLVRFALWSSVFAIHCCRKSEKLEMHRMTSDWPWTLKNEKYSVSTKYLLTVRGPNFGPFRSTTKHFQDITQF